MIRRIFAASLLILAVAVAPAAAQVVTSNVEGNNAGVFTSDPQGPSATAVTSSLTFPGAATVDFSGTGFGQAVQRPDGVGGVSVDGLFANGQLGNYIEARTTWSETATNGTAGPLDYVFTFFITPASLRIADFAGLPDASNNAPTVSFEVIIRANGVEVFSAGASMFGGNNSHTLTETGTSLSPTFVTAGSAFGYDFAPYTQALSLGTVASGNSITVEYEMIARVDTPGFEAGGSASVGDPFDLDGTPGVTGSLTPDIPLPTEERTWGAVKALYR